MSKSPPDELFTHNRPENVDEKFIDDEILESFRLLNAVDGIHTSLTCQGHPESESLHVWGTKLRVELMFHIDLADEMFELKDMLQEGVPDSLSPYMDQPETDMYMYLSSTFRQSNMDWNYTFSESPWQGISLTYDYQTVGERRAFIRVLEASIREVFNVSV